jgi:hypothetical protein
MYVTEYRKALRDAGFDGFRVMLFQQTGGLKQATGEESGLDLSPKFFWGIVKALVAGDVLNALGYRIRPYEVNAGDTDRAIEECKKIIYDGALDRTNILVALWKCKPLLEAVKVDRTRPQAEGQHHRRVLGDDDRGRRQLPAPALPRERGRRGRHPARHRVAPLHVWEGEHDTAERRISAAPTRPSTASADSGPFGVAQEARGSSGRGKYIIRGLFQTFAHAMGLYGYHLPTWTRSPRSATSITTTISAAAKATWRSASSS